MAIDRRDKSAIYVFLPTKGLNCRNGRWVFEDFWILFICLFIYDKCMKNSFVFFLRQDGNESFAYVCVCL